MGGTSKCHPSVSGVNQKQQKENNTMETIEEKKIALDIEIKYLDLLEETIESLNRDLKWYSEKLAEMGEDDSSRPRYCAKIKALERLIENLSKLA